MNTAEEILENKKNSIAGSLFDEDIIDVVHEFANQFKSFTSIEDKLPKEGSEVIVYHSGYKQQLKALFAPVDGKSYWLAENGDYLGTITHWHYLLPNPA